MNLWLKMGSLFENRKYVSNENSTHSNKIRKNTVYNICVPTTRNN